MIDRTEIVKVGANAPGSLFLDVAQIHKEVISKGFLASFHKKALARFYLSVATSPHSFLYIARNSDQILGFICGTSNTGAFYRSFFARHAIFAAPYAIVNLLSFKRIFSLLETIAYPSRNISINAIELPENEILNFCVVEKALRMGIGKLLFQALVDQFRNSGFREIKIVTGEDQVAAQQFYNDLDAVKVAEIEVHKGTRSIIFNYVISGS